MQHKGEAGGGRPGRAADVSRKFRQSGLEMMAGELAAAEEPAYFFVSLLQGCAKSANDQSTVRLSHIYQGDQKWSFPDILFCKVGIFANVLAIFH